MVLSATLKLYCIAHLLVYQLSKPNYAFTLLFVFISLSLSVCLSVCVVSRLLFIFNLLRHSKQISRSYLPHATPLYPPALCALCSLVSFKCNWAMIRNANDLSFLLFVSNAGEVFINIAKRRLCVCVCMYVGVCVCV